MSGQGGDESGFLSRWSRLKRDQADIKPVETVATEPVNEDDATLPFDPDRLEIPLPSLEDLKPGDTLVAFMQKGVPTALRNAALRKMWALDPMVRDFRSEALDYAWDWNAPGGVPGAGPLGASDRVEDMIEALFRPSEPQADTPETETVINAATEGATNTTVVEAETPDRTVVEPPASDGSGDDTQKESPHPRRRHGGAMPQA